MTHELDVFAHDLGKVAIVALGPSHHDWVLNALGKGEGAFRRYDHVWTVNRGGRVFRSDICFMMDYLMGEEDFEPGYVDDVRNMADLVVTSIRDPYEDVVEYPLLEVASWARPHPPYFHNSVPYMLALAGYLGVKEIHLYGCDYTTPGGGTMEAGRANVEYWIGVLRDRGVRVGVTTSSTLFDAHQPPFLYGYPRSYKLLRDIERLDAGTQERNGELFPESADARYPTPLGGRMTKGAQACVHAAQDARLDDTGFDIGSDVPPREASA